ncbi:UPF0481 protein At3g47200-like [Malania oleifera]|uniref:UPF0481 protein At3g47200-like n=1 Tax=Malania oleifera TaxID=397392 RepID=UPI0025AEB0C1|nr:UPF0481 protein At3g47200-like [Malania oleifera]
MITSALGSAPPAIEHECKFEAINIPLLPEGTYSSSEDSVYGEWSKCCIYRVPQKLRSINEAAYTPRIVSIGPFHHGNPQLRPMEGLKSRYLKEFCRKAINSLDDIKKIVTGCEQSIRACYAGTFELKKDKFLDMVVTDAGFIIEFLWRSTDEPEKDYIFSKPYKCFCVHCNGRFKENDDEKEGQQSKSTNFYSKRGCPSNHKDLQGDHCQQSQRELKNSDSSFLELTKSYFSKYFDLNLKGHISEVKHFTDLLRYSFCPPREVPYEADSENRIESLRSATYLDEAGVDFEVCQHPTLELPRFEANDTTECVFRNLMALEQCHYPKQVHICNYISLMDQLINTREDVDLLIEKKVIVNSLGSSKAVAKLLNKLCEHIVEPNSRYCNTVQEIKRHCKNPLNRIMAALTNVYFRDFWRGTASIVGIVVLGLTIWNTLLRQILQNKIQDSLLYSKFLMFARVICFQFLCEILI